MSALELGGVAEWCEAADPTLFVEDRAWEGLSIGPHGDIFDDPRDVCSRSICKLAWELEWTLGVYEFVGHLLTSPTRWRITRRRAHKRLLDFGRPF